jgi:hypothetical protein
MPGTHKGSTTERRVCISPQVAQTWKRNTQPRVAGCVSDKAGFHSTCQYVGTGSVMQVTVQEIDLGGSSRSRR